MTSEHLLPSNATPLEQALSLATDALSRLALPTDAIRQFKTDPSDPLLPWLIWGELLHAGKNVTKGGGWLRAEPG